MYSVKVFRLGVSLLISHTLSYCTVSPHRFRMEFNLRDLQQQGTAAKSDLDATTTGPVTRDGASRGGLTGASSSNDKENHHHRQHTPLSDATTWQL
jgi:hypothetical protein